MYKSELLQLFKIARVILINANNSDEVDVANSFIDRLDKILYDNHINDDFLQFSLNQLKCELKDKINIKSKL